MEIIYFNTTIKKYKFKALKVGLLKLKVFDNKNLKEYKKQYKDSFTFKYAFPFLSKGSEKLIENLETEVKVLQLSSGKETIITINHKEYSNAYTVSPFGHYISYCYDELYCLNNKFLEFLLRPLVYLLGLTFKLSSINNIVIINSIMFSTNLVNDLSSEDLKEIKDYILSTYKDKTIIFRNLNNYLYSDISSSLEKLDFKRIPSRQIYLVKKESTLTKSARKKLNQDYKLIEKNNLEVITIKDTIYSKAIVNLYTKLYIDKYSKSNPIITEDLVSSLIENDNFIFRGLLDENKKLIGIIGCFSVNNTLTTPILGYDTDLNISLYRMLTSMINKLGAELNCNLHRSSGVGQFKRNRGAVKDIEFMYYYNKHLSFIRKLPYKMLSILNSKWVIDFIMKNDF